MKKTRLFSAVLAIVMIASMLSCFSFGASAADGIAKNANVVFVADAGSDDAAGTLDAPVQTLAKAVEKLASTGGVIVVVGQVTLDPYNCIMPANEKLITVTSYYDGVDYRAKLFGSDATGARIILGQGIKAAWSYNGDFEFDWINFAIPNVEGKQPIIACYYNNITYGANVGTLYEDAAGVAWYDGTFVADTTSKLYPPILMTGQNKSTDYPDLWMGGLNVEEPFTLTIKGGDWQSVRVGDRDVLTRNVINTTATLNISGGRFTTFFDSSIGKDNNECVMGCYQAIIGPKGVVNMNITGGTFYGCISAFGQVSASSAGDAIHEGVINVNLLGGTIAREHNLDGGYILVSQMSPGAKGGLTFTDTCQVNIQIASENLKWGFEDCALSIIPEAGVKSTLKISKQDDRILCDMYPDVVYGPLSTSTPTTPDTTAAPTVDTTAAPTVDTTVAPTVDTTVAPTVDTTVAPAQPEPTPSTGDSTVFVVFAAAAVATLAAVVVLKKREER